MHVREECRECVAAGAEAEPTQPALRTRASSVGSSSGVIIVRLATKSQLAHQEQPKAIAKPLESKQTVSPSAWVYFRPP